MATRPERGRDTRVCVAQIGAAHGLRGGVHLRSFTADPQAFATYGPLETEDGSRRLEIESLRPAKDGFTARFHGVTKREAAEALRNVNLYVDRGALPPAEDGEFYHADLIGLSARSSAGDVLGEVVAIHNFGAGDIIELQLKESGTTLLAFDELTVPQIDIAGGWIVVELPAETEVREANAETSQ